MALADSVPGVSGGTIVFILGFYERFFDALHNVVWGSRAARKDACIYLLKLGVVAGPSAWAAVWCCYPACLSRTFIL